MAIFIFLLYNQRMLVIKQKYYLFLLAFLLLPFSGQAAWSEPSQVPPGGNTALPVYTTGSGQSIDGTLHVGTPGSYATALQGTGSTNGIQGNSAANALFGNLSASGVGGNRAVYGLAVDAADYGLFSSGGMGLGFASGDIWFIQQDAGIAWPRESDGQGLYGIMVNPSGELQVRGHGAGINFMNQTPASLMTISEAGVVNVAAGGSLTVNTTPVCLQNGAGCPSEVIPTLQQVTTSGNSTTNGLDLRGALSNGAGDLTVNDWADIQWGLKNSSANNSGNLYVADNAQVTGNLQVDGNITTAGQNVCRQNGVNCPPDPPPPAGSNLWAPNGNDIYPTFSGAVKINTTLQFNSELAAQATIDFDPLNASKPGGNYFILQSGISPTYGQRQQMRVNRAGETLLGSDLFIGNNNAQGVAIMTPPDNPTVNTAWGIRGKGTATIEAVPGGGVGSVGDINLKSGTLKLKYLNSDAGDVMVNDTLDVQYGIKNSTADNSGAVYVPDDFKVTGGGAFGGYAPDLSYKVTTPSLFTATLYDSGGLYADQILVGAAAGSYKGTGNVNAKQLCIEGDCKSNWAAVASTGSSWSRTNPNVYLSNITDKVGIGIAAPAAKLQINPETNVEGLHIISSNYSPFVVRNTANNDDLARIDQDGNLVIKGINNRFAGATRTVPLAVKTDTNGLGIVIECGMASCDNTLEMKVTNGNYSIIKTETTAAGGTAIAINPSPYAGYNGGKVGIGTIAPNSTLHIKTDNGNAELDIQSANSPYWGIYQDDGTNDLRFWNIDNRLILKTNGLVNILGTLSLGSSASNPTIVSATSEGENDVLVIKNGLGQSVAEFGADLVMDNRRATIFRDWVYFTSDSGSTVLAASGNLTATGDVKAGAGIAAGGYNPSVTHKVTTPTFYAEQAQIGGATGGLKGAGTLNAGQLCINGNCKTAWGPNTGDTFERSLQAPDGQVYDCTRTDTGVLMVGYMMIGIRNTNPARLICAKMW